MNKFGFVIPVYMHGATLKSILDEITKLGYPVILVDDGNPLEIRQYIDTAVATHDGITLVEMGKNCGKGAAMSAGIKKAKDMGISHILQLDADAQHDISYCKSFFDLSMKYPDSIICGYPEYDESVPTSRKNGRRLANFWVHLNSLNNQAKDSMCGFRIYLVDKYVDICNKYNLAKRMCVDCEILIFSSWEGVPIVSAPVKVTYPKDGVSNYNVVWDNVWMTLMFIRTFFGMIIRLPKLLCRKR